MWPVVRLVRATFLFGRIYLSYIWTLELERVRGREAMREQWKLVHAKNAERLYQAMVKLRGVFIKLGQILSVMGTFLPRVYAERLEKLQDQVPPHPFDEIDEVIEESLGQGSAFLFKKFSDKPIAAASLGQVHLAEMHTGEKIAVKVLYPNVATIIRVDLVVMGWAIRVLRRWFPRQLLEAVRDQLRDLLGRETDFRHEATCMKRMADNFAGTADVLFPRVYPELSSDRVLTMTFMEGVKISRRQELEAMGIDPYVVAKLLVESFYKQLFLDGFFHADPHPGNFLVQQGDPGKGPRLVVLDFGAATEAPRHLIDGMIDILRGLFAKDDDLVVKGIHTMGFVSAEGNTELLEDTVRVYFQKLLALDIQDFGRIKAKDMATFADPGLQREQLHELMKAVAYPDGWFYVERAVVIMFGLSAQLAPKLNTVQVGFPYIMRMMAARQMEAAQKPAPAPIPAALPGAAASA